MHYCAHNTVHVLDDVFSTNGSAVATRHRFLARVIAFLRHLRFAHPFNIELLVFKIHARLKMASPAKREGSGKNCVDVVIMSMAPVAKCTRGRKCEPVDEDQIHPRLATTDQRSEKLMRDLRKVHR